MSYVPWKERLVIPTYELELSGKVEIDPEKCNGCGRCALICPGVAISVVGEGRGKKAHFETGDVAVAVCMSCNDCAAICERDAIFVVEPYDFGNYYKTLHRGPMVPPRTF